MTVARATQRRTRLEKQREDVLADLLEGKTQAEVAKKYAVFPTSVAKFADRHSGELEAMSLKVEKAVEDYSIANKVWRVGQLQWLYQSSVDFLEQQGFSERVTRYNRDGDVISETQRYRDSAMAQLRGLLDDAAKELGHRVTKGDTTNIAAVVNIIRGGTPLGMAPVTEVIEAEYTVEDGLTEAPNS